MNADSVVGVSITSVRSPVMTLTSAIITLKNESPLPQLTIRGLKTLEPALPNDPNVLTNISADQFYEGVNARKHWAFVHFNDDLILTS